MRTPLRTALVHSFVILAVSICQIPAASAQESRAADGRLETKIFKLRNLRANQAGQTVQQLYADNFTADNSIEGSRLAADGRSNSLIIRAPAAVLEQIEAVLLQLDQAESSHPRSQDPKLADDSSNGDPLSSRTEMGLGRRLAMNRSPEFQQFELQSQALAQEYQQLQAATPRDEARLAQLKSDLQGAVHSAFDARQTWQRKQIAEMRQRLDGIEKNVSARGQQANEIIQRRIDDLLNPDRQWESPAEKMENRDATRGQVVKSSGQNAPVGFMGGWGHIPGFSFPSVVNGSNDAQSALQNQRGSGTLAAEIDYQNVQRYSDGTDPRTRLLEVETAINSQKAAIAEAEVDAEAAKAILETTTTLHQNATVPYKSLLDAQADAKRKAAALRRAQAELQGKERLLLLAKEHLAAQAKLAEIELKRANTRLEEADQKAKSMQAHFEKGAVSKATYDAAHAAVREARLDVDRATVQFELFHKAVPDSKATEKPERK